MPFRSHAQTASLEGEVRQNARQIGVLTRSNRELVERCNAMTRNLATVAAAFKAIIQAGERETAGNAAEDEEDEAELHRLERRLVTLLAQNAAATQSGSDEDDGADTAAGEEEIDPVAPAAPPPYQATDGPPATPATK